ILERAHECRGHVGTEARVGETPERRGGGYAHAHVAVVPQQLEQAPTSERARVLQPRDLLQLARGRELDRGATRARQELRFRAGFRLRLRAPAGGREERACGDPETGHGPRSYPVQAVGTMIRRSAVDL